MRSALGALVVAAAGCSGFAPPSAQELRALALDAPESPARVVRCRVRLKVDSRWLAGDFDGVTVGWERPRPLVRAQFFGDLGPKFLDLLASPARIAGYFPQSRQGVDCAIPEDAVPHPLLFMGVSLIETYAPVTPDRVRGIRPAPEGWEVSLEPAVPGVGVRAEYSSQGILRARRYRWMYGIGWEERWLGPGTCRITAPDLSLEVEVLGREVLPGPGTFFQFALPPDVRRVK